MLGNEDRMKISTKGRYAVRVMLDLALNNNGECIKVKEIQENKRNLFEVQEGNLCSTALAF